MAKNHSGITNKTTSSILIRNGIAEEVDVLRAQGLGPKFIQNKLMIPEGLLDSYIYSEEGKKRLEIAKNAMYRRLEKKAERTAILVEREVNDLSKIKDMLMKEDLSKEKIIDAIVKVSGASFPWVKLRAELSGELVKKAEVTVKRDFATVLSNVIKGEVVEDAGTDSSESKEPGNPQ